MSITIQDALFEKIAEALFRVDCPDGAWRLEDWRPRQRYIEMAKVAWEIIRETYD